MGAKEIGARVKRREDAALLVGRGSYVGDLRLAGMLDAAFVRSPHAHALVRSIRTEAARRLPGVHAVLTLADLPASMQVPIPMASVIPAAVEKLYASEAEVTQYCLARDEVCYVGQTVAVVVADDRYVAEDAAELVEVEYDVLDSASDPQGALGNGAVLSHVRLPSNLACRLRLAKGDVDAAFQRAAHVFRESLHTHRGSASPMEGRGVAAALDTATGTLTVWSSAQTPHNNQRVLAELMGGSLEMVRVIVPDVGGGFGPKAICYAEEAVVAACAAVLARPVRWLEDRREHFIATTQERDQYWEVEIALDRDARILGVRGRMLHDNGAYLPLGLITPHTGAATMHGPYEIANFHLDVSVVLTNKVPVSVVRGAGRPEGVFAMERLMDRAARSLGMDPADLRRRNLIRPEQMPYSIGLVYRHGETVTYDSGDYPASQAKALELAGYDAFASRQADALRAGRYIGIGVANFVEGTGLGPFEGATVRVLPSGKVHVIAGCCPQGQGHKTALAQVCADQLGVRLDDITVVTGDTGAIPMGVGTIASRSGANAGSAVLLAGAEVRKRILRLACKNLEAREDDLELSEGRVHLKGDPAASVSFSELYRAALGGARLGGWLSPEIPPGLEATTYFTPRQSAFCNGTHVTEVEVDIGTGRIRIERYVVVHDCGRVINPLIVEGQVQGGVAHGVGNALLEFMGYDDDAQPLTATFLDYLLPNAACVPRVEIGHLESPSPINPLGVKGAGEGGTIGAPAAIIAAIENALKPFDIAISEFPLTPRRLIELLSRSAKWGALAP